MTKIDKAVEWAVQIANDSSHGYDQARRNGPDYDCSSLLCEAWQRAGVPVMDHGASFTRNMLLPFLACGFKDITAEVNQYSGAGLRKGDVLLNQQYHTAMMVSDTQLVQASSNENGTATGGRTGDQTGNEIAVRSYYRYSKGWDTVLRYMGDDNDDDGNVGAGGSDSVVSADGGAVLPELKKGSTGSVVVIAQRRLIALGYDLPRYGADGDYGDETRFAVMALQNDYEITPDGEIGEAETWPILLDNLRH